MAKARKCALSELRLAESSNRASTDLDDPKDRPEPKAKLHLSQTLHDR